MLRFAQLYIVDRLLWCRVM